MASADPFIIELSNPNIDADNNQIIYLIAARDDEKNTLTLDIKNVSGSAVSFTPETPLSLSMKAVLPPDVIRNIQVACPSASWQSSVTSADGNAQGWSLTPTSPFSLANDEIITFTFTNIVFTSAELAQGRTMMNDCVLSYSVPAPRREVPLKMCLTRWTDTQQPLTYFEAAFVPVPTSEPWNVKVDDVPLRINTLAEDAVFSNSINGQSIRTRLAFRLTNQDEIDPLTLTPSSSFSLSFLPGQGFGELGDGQDLMTNVTIRELNTSDWTIEQATDAGSPTWTLSPKGSISLAAQGGSYDFLIDAVLPNGNPPQNDSGSGATLMYIVYTSVPKRKGGGSYDDGYLAATIKKVAPLPQIPSVTVSPAQDTYDWYKPIEFSWTAFGAESVQVSYTDSEGLHNVPKSWHGTLQATPLEGGMERKSNLYQCTSAGAAQPGTYFVWVKSFPEALVGRTYELALGYHPAPNHLELRLSSVDIRFIDDKHVTLSAHVDSDKVALDVHQFVARGTWAIKDVSGGLTGVSLALDASGNVLATNALGNDGNRYNISLTGAVTSSLYGQFGDYIMGSNQLIGDPIHITVHYDISTLNLLNQSDQLDVSPQGMIWGLTT